MTILARLSFPIADEALAEFGRLYEQLVLPVLRSYDLEEAGPDQRQAPQRFNRLFALSSLAQTDRIKQLKHDPIWRKTIADLTRHFAAEDLPYSFDLYQVPADRPQTVEVGHGTRQGLWHSLSPQDGLPASMIYELFRDSRGRLWFTAFEGGFGRYDGAHFFIYTTTEGLNDNSVAGLYEDRAGDLWFTTSNSLCRFDGESFHYFTSADGLPDHALNASTHRSLICADREGRLWLYGAANGIACFNDGRFTHYSTEDGLAHNKVEEMLLDRRGRLWFATQNGTSVFNGETFTSYSTQDGLAHNQVNGLLEDRHGRLWFATQNGASVFDGETFTSYSTQDGLAHNQINGLLEDRHGRLWFGCDDACPTCYDGKRFKALAGAHHASYPKYEDRDGLLWFNSDYSGVLRYDGERTQAFTTVDGLAHDQVNDMLEDEQGFLWMATWGGGLSRFDGKHFAHFTKADLGAKRVEVLRADREGRIWMGTWGGGMVCFDGERISAHTACKGGLAHDSIWSVCIDTENNVWCGTCGGGVSRFDGETFTNYTTQDGLAHDSVWSICQDGDGHMWFGTQGGGVSRFDGETFTNYTTQDGLAHDSVWSIVEDREGQIWFSCLDSGICRFDGETFANYTSKDGLAHDNVSYLLIDHRGYLWCGTWGGGVSRFDGETFTNYTSRDGLADDNVRSICEDAQNHLWFGTYGGGVSRFDGRVFQTIAQKDGLIHNAVQHVEQAPDGAMWIATESGVSRYRPSAKPPVIHLRDVVADRRYAPGEDIAVSVAQRLVAFEFQGASFATAPDQFAYVYQLDGFDADWQTIYQRRVEYRDLPPGDYTFRVRAVDRDLNYSPPAEVALTITPDMQQDRITALAAELSQSHGLEQFIGQSHALKETFAQIHTVADTDVTVLILGETGTGKGLAAKAIHSLSTRKDEPLIQLNCGAIPDGLVESELFGHEKGAFTGAVARKIGRFELADGGTLFLDEIGDLPLESQQVLLHVLQDGTFQRVGGDRTLSVDVRVVAATNRDLRNAMRAGTFREDLYFRLSAFALHLPPLRERQEDVPLLLQYFVEQFSRHLHRPLPSIDAGVLPYLQQHAWPGNVRELEHLAQHALLVCKNDHITPDDIPIVESEGLQTIVSDREFTTLDEQRAHSEAAEKALIEKALQATNWIVFGERGAAKLLNTHPERLRMRMRKYGLKRKK